MANTSIFAAFERMWHHVLVAIGNKADLDHSHNVSEIADLQEHLKDNSQMKLNIFLPAGRAKGDFNGDGVIDGKDASLILQYCDGFDMAWEPSDIDLWAADMDGNGVIDANDNGFVLQYCAELFDEISDFMLDYYGNWIWDNSKNCFYYDAIVDGITSSHSAIIFADTIVKGSVITGAECMDGFIRVYATCVPTVDINCGMVCNFVEGGTIIVGSQNMSDISGNIDDTLTKEGFVADAKATGDAIAEVSDRIDDFVSTVEESLKFIPITQADYDMLVASGKTDPEIAYLIVGGTA